MANDPRLFHVYVKGQRVATLPVLEARARATKERHATADVRLRNYEDGSWYSWWPELGGHSRRQE